MDEERFKKLCGIPLEESTLTKKNKCHRCKHPDIVEFNVPEHIWESVSGKEWSRLCLNCFDELAYKKNVDYAHHMGSLWFSADQGGFEYIPKSALDRSEFASLK